MTHVQWDTNLSEWVWEHAVWGLAFVGKDGKWIKVNPALCKMLSYTEGELLGMTWVDITDPRDTNIDHAEIAKIVSGQHATYTTIKRFLTKQGRALQVRLTVFPWRGETQDSEIMFFLSQIVDASPVGPSLTIPTTDDQDVAATFRFVRKHWKWLLVAVAFVAGDEYIIRLVSLFANLTNLSPP